VVIGVEAMSVIVRSIDSGAGWDARADGMIAGQREPRASYVPMCGRRTP
jgi:hypothetical protein